MLFVGCLLTKSVEKISVMFTDLPKIHPNYFNIMFFFNDKDIICHLKVLRIVSNMYSIYIFFLIS